MRGSFEAKYQCLFPYTWHVEAKLLLLFCEHTSCSSANIHESR